MLRRHKDDDLRQEALGLIYSMEVRHGKSLVSKRLAEQMESGEDALKGLVADQIFIDYLAGVDVDWPVAKKKGRSDSIKSNKAAERRKNVRKAQKRARKRK